MQALNEIKNCTVCEAHLPLGANPIVKASTESRIVIIGQAPGIAVHKTSIPWNDKSGENLRNWLGVDNELFYDDKKIALIPMGFCYPGTGKSGDLPPRKECAPLWHPLLFEQLKNVKLTILIGQYAQAYYLKNAQKNNLTETVRDFEKYLPRFFPLPHPSPRNNSWQAKNNWFAEKVLPSLKENVKALL